MRKTLAAIALSLLAACTGGTVVTSGDPCLEYAYQNPACDSNYSWNAGYYDTSHVWVRPRYVRRTVIVAPTYHYSPPVYVPPPVVVRPAPVIVNRGVVVRSQTYVAPSRTVTTTRTTTSSGSSLRLNGRRIR